MKIREDNVLRVQVETLKVTLSADRCSESFTCSLTLTSAPNNKSFLFACIFATLHLFSTLRMPSGADTSCS